jgi:hypothetical protein
MSEMDADARGRARIAAQRGGECVITYDGTPSYSVSIMEFADEHAVHETQYFADPFDAPASRAALAERI